jgi:hypothetical protein
MDIKDFAAQYRARVNDKKFAGRYGLEANEDTIFGKYGEIVDDSSYGTVLAVKFIAVPRGAAMTKALAARRRAAEAGGLMLKRLYGDAESTWHFNPANEQRARLALKLVGARFKRVRVLTEEQKLVLRDRMLAARNAKKLPLAA